MSSIELSLMELEFEFKLAPIDFQCKLQIISFRKLEILVCSLVVPVLARPLLVVVVVVPVEFVYCCFKHEPTFVWPGAVSIAIWRLSVQFCSLLAVFLRRLLLSRLIWERKKEVSAEYRARSWLHNLLKPGQWSDTISSIVIQRARWRSVRPLAFVSRAIMMIYYRSLFRASSFACVRNCAWIMQYWKYCSMLDDWANINQRGRLILPEFELQL